LATGRGARRLFDGDVARTVARTTGRTNSDEGHDFATRARTGGNLPKQREATISDRPERAEAAADLPLDGLASAERAKNRGKDRR
jgi:hypothetical protein